MKLRLFYGGYKLYDPVLGHIPVAPKCDAEAAGGEGDAEDDEEDDNTGAVQLSDLEPHTRYYYKVRPDGGEPGLGGSFRTLREPGALVDPALNPKGLFNFKFEFGCGNTFWFENSKCFYDLIIRNARVVSSETERTDIAIQYIEVLKANTIVFKPVVETISELSNFSSGNISTYNVKGIFRYNNIFTFNFVNL